ncbi:ABC transporter ATP-binding protein [Dokdonella sp. MW10]|uniref:ABC transporter ATP-binding protein n=1 Tax=Dokdonella sp. MW10 TaxID=2992926 RepID=UPI003F8159F9
MAFAIHTRELCHRHPGGGSALHALDLRVPEGSLYGFLGANGAGKTTTMRLLLGLLQPDSGDITIFGEALPRARERVLGMIGSMIESPALYAHLDARENLALLQIARRLPRARIDEVLEAVGLADIDRRTVGQFSLGMKQRLGIAAALLHAPRLLILDEPTNGLDPVGIIAMRDLLRRLNTAGITIVLSSHLLSEIGRLADHVGVIRAGRLVFQGSMDALRQAHARAAGVVIGTDDPVGAHALIARHVPAARLVDDAVHVPATDDATRALLNRCLVAGGIGVHEIRSGTADMESLYLAAVETTP